MWSDNDIDTAFQRLSPPEPEPAPFPLDAWLRLETQLDKAVIERAVRRRVWQFFAAELAVVALAVLGWLLWPSPAGGPFNQTTETTTVQPKAGQRPATTLNRQLPGANTPATAVSATPELPVPAATGLAQASAAPASASAQGQGENLADEPTAAIPPAERSPATTTATTTWAQSGHPKLSATKWLATRSNARRATATETAFASTGRGPTGSRPERPAQPGTPAAANRSAAEASTIGLATEPATDTRARQSTSLPQARNQATDARAATATTPAATTAPGFKQIFETSLPTHPVALLLAAGPELPTPLPVAPLAEAVAPVIPPALARLPRFYLGLVAAPDVSTVKFTKVQAPMPNLGLTLEYRLSSRLRLSTGLLRSTKQYSARREDYDWGPYATRVYQRDFQNVDATCTVLDVPLNLRYDLLTRPRYLLVGSVGLSSFFMQRERYSYAYVENNMPQRWQRDAVNENRHLLSILNLSVGYEGRLSDHWSFQAEPYLKLPLAGVGAGQVRLTSAGVFAGVKYGFN